MFLGNQRPRWEKFNFLKILPVATFSNDQFEYCFKTVTINLVWCCILPQYCPDRFSETKIHFINEMIKNMYRKILIIYRGSPKSAKSSMKMAAILNFSKVHYVITFIAILLGSVALKMWVWTPILCFYDDQRLIYEQFNFRQILMRPSWKVPKKVGRPNL